MLTLNNRPCLLGLKSSTDGKEIDGAEVKLLTLELEDVVLDKRELNVLLGEPHAWNVLYNTGVKPVEPYLKSLKSLELREAVEGAAVTLAFGLNSGVAFTRVKLSKLKLELKSGGETALSCKLTATPALDTTFAQLLEHLGDGIEVEMRFEPAGQQQDLPLNAFGEGTLRDGTPYTLQRSETPTREDDEGDDEDDEEAAKPARLAVPKAKRKRKPSMPPPKSRKAATNGHARR